MKINFQPWHKEVISLWEKLISENKVVQATLYAYKLNSGLIVWGVDLDEKGKVELSRFDEQFFGMFASENADQRSSESVTRILEDQIYYISKKVLEDLENNNEIQIKMNHYRVAFSPLTRGVYLIENDPVFIDLEKFTPEIITQIKNVISIFEKNLMAA